MDFLGHILDINTKYTEKVGVYTIIYPYDVLYIDERK